MILLTILAAIPPLVVCLVGIALIGTSIKILAGDSLVKQSLKNYGRKK